VSPQGLTRKNGGLVILIYISATIENLENNPQVRAQERGIGNNYGIHGRETDGIVRRSRLLYDNNSCPLPQVRCRTNES
jgi:hypothetical protein